ncbi:MAG TPA: efflux transporter outer membrane subunit [Burkholderiales bacterium]
MSTRTPDPSGRAEQRVEIRGLGTRIVAAALLAYALGGCMLLGPNYKRPEVSLPDAYPDASSASAGPSVPTDWWRLYSDPGLDNLVASGLQKNSDLKLAIARMEEAEALVREANATFLPEIDLNASAGRSRASTRTGTLPPTVAVIRNNFLISANTSFELDFWGRLRRGREAAFAQYAASRYGHDVVRLTLAASIAQTYFNIRALDAQIIVSNETLKAAEDSLDIANARAQAGVSSDLDVNQADANRAQVAAQIKELRRLRALASHLLGVFTGVLDLDIPPADVWQLPVPPLPPAGLPSTLLERRPDLRQAEATLMSANAQIGVARAAQFPTLSLTGALGVQSRDLSTLTSSGAGIWSIGLGIVGPILDWGRYAARTQQAEARAKEAAAVYEKTAQTAFREVADALSNVRLAAETEQDLRDRVERANNTLRLATQRYRAGYSAYLEVLDAQRTHNEAQLSLARNRQAYLAYTVDLMNALGGGWTPY